LPAGRRRSRRDAYRERRALLDELALNATRWRTPRAFSIEADFATITRPPPDPQDQLLPILDIFDEWFHSDDFEASVFINVLLEMGASHPTGQASVHYLENLRSVVAAMVQEAGLRDPERSFAPGTSSCRDPSSPPPRATSTPPNAPKLWAAYSKLWAAYSSTNTDPARKPPHGPISRSTRPPSHPRGPAHTH
jgi:hypothetical protein